MKNFVSAWICLICVGMVALLLSCAGERQGVVCDEIEYRLNTLTYSPDQRAFQEDELRTCREEEANKKGAAAEKRKSIYERFAANDSAKTATVASDSGATENAAADVSVSELMGDSSGESTTSIYDRYGAVNGSAVNGETSDNAVAADSNAVPEATP